MLLDKESIERIQSELHAKYNERIDSSIIVVLLELAEKTEAQKRILEEATRKINDSQKVNHYNFTSNGQAFWHGFGKYGAALVVIIISIFIFSISYFPILKNRDLAINLVERYELKKDNKTGQRVISSKLPFSLVDIKGDADVKNLVTGEFYIYSNNKKQIYSLIKLSDQK